VIITGRKVRHWKIASWIKWRRLLAVSWNRQTCFPKCCAMSAKLLFMFSRITFSTLCGATPSSLSQSTTTAVRRRHGTYVCHAVKNDQWQTAAHQVRGSRQQGNVDGKWCAEHNCARNARGRSPGDGGHGLRGRKWLGGVAFGAGRTKFSPRPPHPPPPGRSRPPRLIFRENQNSYQSRMSLSSSGGDENGLCVWRAFWMVAWKEMATRAGSHPAVAGPVAPPDCPDLLHGDTNRWRLRYPGLPHDHSHRRHQAETGPRHRHIQRPYAAT